MSANSKQQQSKKEKDGRKELLRWVRSTFCSEDSRALLGFLFDQTGVFTDPMDGESDQHFIGRRSIGIQLLGLCNAADPEIYIKTLRGE